MLPFLFFVPVLAPLALLLVFAWRWYWVLTPRDRHSSGPIRHLIYIALMPGAMAGTILLTWLGLRLIGDLFWVPHEDHAIYIIARWWVDVSIVLLAKTLGAYAAMHDWITKALSTLGMSAADTRWLPDAWSATDAWVSKARSALAAHENWKWELAFVRHMPEGALWLVLVPGYFALSHWNHSHIARLLKQERTRQERERLAAEEKQRAVEAEIARLRAGGTPKLSTGKPSAMEF